VSFELHAANKDPTRARCPLNLRFGSVNLKFFTGVRIETLVGVGGNKNGRRENDGPCNYSRTGREMLMT